MTSRRLSLHLPVICGVVILSLYTITVHSISSYFLAFSNGKASKRNDKVGNRNDTSLSRGFGRPQNLNNLLKTYPNRVPSSTNNQQQCPCGVDGKSYRDCCLAYHSKLLLPESPKRVLQTRYSAFVYRLIGYIMDSTHPTCRDYRDDKVSWAKDLNKHGMFDSIDFISLNITNETQSAMESNVSEAFIEFQVTLQSKNIAKINTDSQQQQITSNIDDVLTIQERSKFLKDVSTGGWLYASGVVRTTTSGIDNIILNQ